MLVLRSLRILTKIKLNNVTPSQQFIYQHSSRRFSRQRVEFAAVDKSTAEQKDGEIEVTLNTDEQQHCTQYTATASKYATTEFQQIERSEDPQQQYKTVKQETDALSANEDAQLVPLSPEEDTQSSSVEVAKKDYAPTFNLAAYVNNSPTLQQFIQLGVDLHSIERRKGLAEFVLRLEFERDVKPYLFFLQDQGVSPDVFGELITKNPLLFKIDLDDLQTRINYLEAKNFTPADRTRIITRNPFWLMFSTRRIDHRLGYFQKEFHLKGDDVRFLAAKQPRLITYNMDHIRKSTFCIREEMGFDKDEIKCLLLSKPRLWMLKSDGLIERFAYAHKEMQLSHEMLIQVPEVLISREFRLRQRHEFLKMLGRAHYDPQHDMYISPKAVVEGTDYEFVHNVAKSEMKTYELFLRTR